MQSLTSGPLAPLVHRSPALAHQVTELIKIGNQEETNNISEFAMGGGPGAIYAQTQKIICTFMLSDPTPATVPVLSTFFAYPNGQFCPSYSQLKGWWPTFKRLVNEMAAAIRRSRALVLEEIDAIGTALCVPPAARVLWLRELAYESAAFGALPHTVAYLEAGSSDENPVKTTAQLLIKGGVTKIRGFFTNDTHFNWSINEIKYDDSVSADIKKFTAPHPRSAAGGFVAHFVVNTAQNGRGPLLNKHPVTQGIEDLCNPPGRGLGRIPTGTTDPTFDGHSFPLLDGFLWTGVPGRSHSNTCSPGAAPAGVFDVPFAVELAQNANQKLGPGYPSLPY